jgi:hypothetical protein
MINEDDEMGGTCSMRGEMTNAHAILAGQAEAIRALEYRGADRKIKLRWMLRKRGGTLQTVLICLWIGADGQLLWIRSWVYGFHKSREICWLAEQPSVFQEELCSKELVYWVPRKLTDFPSNKTTKRNNPKIIPRIVESNTYISMPQGLN